MEHNVIEVLCKEYDTKIKECKEHDCQQIRELISELDEKLAENEYELPIPFIVDFLIATSKQLDHLKPKDIDFDDVSNDIKLACMGLYTNGIIFIIKHWNLSNIDPGRWDEYVRPKLAPMYFDLPDLAPGYAELLLNDISSKLTDDELDFLDFLPKGKNCNFVLIYVISLRANSLIFRDEEDQDILEGIKHQYLAIKILYSDDDDRFDLAIDNLKSARKIFSKYASNDKKYGFTNIKMREFLEFAEFNTAFGYAKAGNYVQARTMLKTGSEYFNDSSMYNGMLSELALDLELPDDAICAFNRINVSNLDQDEKQDYRALKARMQRNKRGSTASPSERSQLRTDVAGQDTGFKRLLIFAGLIVLLFLLAKSC